MENKLSESFLKNLLYQNEGNTLDFKEKQYPFNGATDEQKSELLKDILAFANAFRTEEAYIVIGIKAEEGKIPHTVVGCQDHFDDAKLQQFVNSKTNRIVTLAYEIHLLENQPIGIIRIPKQERPVYLKKDFGKVKKEFVYYRQGSSTPVANPDIIYQMGKIDTIAENQAPPILKLQFADAENQKELGTSIKFTSDVYEEPSIKLKQARRQDEFSQRPINFHYWREIEEYTRIKNEFRAVSFLIYNQSSNLAKNIHIEIINDLDDQVLAKTQDYIPNTKPSWENFMPRFISRGKEEKIIINPYSKGWKLMINVGDIKPQSTVWTEPFYIAALKSKTINLPIQIYGDNLPKPENHNLTVEFEVINHPSLTIDDLRFMYYVPSDII